jgi:protein SCO1
MQSITRRQLLGAATVVPFAGTLVAAATGPDSKGCPVKTMNVPSTSGLSPKKMGQMTAMAREAFRKRSFPDVTLITHEGKSVRLYDDLMKDKIVTINFFYSQCEGICPKVTDNLARVQKMFGDRVGREMFMYSFTLKPEYDTPGVLKDYAESYGAKPGWTFLTGTPDVMEKIRISLGFQDSNPVVDKDKSSHTGNLRFGNEPLMLWGCVPAMGAPSWIARAITFAFSPEINIDRS